MGTYCIVLYQLLENPKNRSDRKKIFWLWGRNLTSVTKGLSECLGREVLPLSQYLKDVTVSPLSQIMSDL